MSNLELSKANRTKVINSFPTREMGKEGDIIISKIKGKGYFLCTKVGNTWYAANKLNELKRLASPKLPELQVDSLRVNNLQIKKQPANAEISLSKGNLTLDVEGDIALSADGGNITLDDGTATIFDFDVNNTNFKMMDDTNTSDYFKISVGLEGKTTLSTTDADTAAGHLTLDVDGDIILDPASGITKFYKAGDADDLCTLTVDANGVTSIATADSDGAAGHLTIAPDGDLKLTPATGIMYLYDSDNSVDYTKFTVGTHGDLTISTVDAALTAAHLILDADGDITLDAAGADIHIDKDGVNFGSINTSTVGKFKLKGNTNVNVILESQGSGDIQLLSTDNITIAAVDTLTLDSDGTYIMKKDNVEFSATNSAYAGMILGYTALLNDAADTSYSITASYVTVHADAKITFVAPPSGNVEIFASAYLASTSTRQTYFGLSDNATYNTIDVTHEHEVWIGDETDENTLNHQWVITGLTAGNSYTYWLGAKAAQAGRISMKWGGDVTGEYAPLIMKATALPATIYEG